MARSFVQWGISALVDDDLASVSANSQGAFPWLLLLAAQTEDGLIGRIATEQFLRGRGWDAAAVVVEELITNGLLTPEGKRWAVAGWSKYQPRFDKYNSSRATTREGRRLGLSVDEDHARVHSPSTVSVDETVPIVDASTEHNTTDIRGNVETSTRGVPSPLLSSTPITEDVPKKNGGVTFLTPGARVGAQDDRDLQDLLYELCGIRPWGKDWGKAAVDLGVEYGEAEAEIAMRAVIKERPGTKPWHVVQKADAILARDREKAKKRQQQEAAADRSKRGNQTDLSGISFEEFQKRAATYRDQ